MPGAMTSAATAPCPQPTPGLESHSLGSGRSSADLLLRALGYESADLAGSARIYDQLRQIAHAHRARWGGNTTVCTTALIHEAYIKLARSGLRFQTRAHFVATASRAMRQVLVTYAEAQCTQKRGGGDRALSLDEVGDLLDCEPEVVAAVGESLRRLAKRDARGARVVECRFFAGLTVDETAEALGLSAATVRRAWDRVRTWLYLDLHPDAAA